MVDQGVDVDRGIHPPEDASLEFCLELLAVEMPPPISSMITRRVVPIRDFHQADVCDLAAYREHALVPLEVSIPMEEYQSAPLRI